MAHEIREIFVTLVQVGSRKYIFNCYVLTPVGYSLLMKWSGVNKWGKRVSIRDIYTCFVLQQVLRKLLEYLPKVAAKIFKSCPKVVHFTKKLLKSYFLSTKKKSVSTGDGGKSLNIYTNYLLI